ncbi:MAG TPA: hypothetical protein GXX51_11410 [Firmicutes bacterium]|nr:hypothetical protein [Bacillota bacterium]
MNKVQRRILIAGAIVFFLLLVGAPRVKYGPNGVILKGGIDYSVEYADVIDVRTAIIYGLAVLGATALLWLAFKDKERTPKPPNKETSEGS